MSAAALAQRLRAGVVPGLNQAERNGWNASANTTPFQKNAIPFQSKIHKEQEVTLVYAPVGTGGTGGTGVSDKFYSQNAESRPKRSDPFAIGANWRPLPAAYYRHHFTCLSCPAGADLWATYEAATDAAHDINTRRIST